MQSEIFSCDMIKKYCLHGGTITSKYDGDIHHIPAWKVGDLFGVNPEECQMHHPGNIHTLWPGMICLYPQSNGNYTLSGDCCDRNC